MRFLPALTLIILITFQTAFAQAGSCAPGCKPACSGGAAECTFRCRPVASQETVTRECFEVECEYICIPGIRFPWQDCCEPPRCGKVRRVRRLTSQEYECGTRTVWDWELTCHCRPINSIPPGCRGAGAPGCCMPID